MVGCDEKQSLKLHLHRWNTISLFSICQRGHDCGLQLLPLGSEPIYPALLAQVDLFSVNRTLWQTLKTACLINSSQEAQGISRGETLPKGASPLSIQGALPGLLFFQQDRLLPRLIAERRSSLRYQGL